MAPADPLTEPAREETPLSDLDELERRILVYASALGLEFDFGLLVDSIEVDEERIAEAAERLVARRILRERPGGDRFLFVDDALRGRIYLSLTQSRLRVVHRKIAEAMERRATPPPPEVVPELGRHFFLGRVPDKSFRYNLEAADLAEQDGLPEVAALHLERARLDRPHVAGLGPDAESRLAERLGHLYFALGDLRAAARLFSEGLDGAGGSDPRRQAELWLARARVARDLKDTETAIAGTRRAQELYETVDDIAGLATVHRSLARLAFDRSRYQDALEEGMLALDLLQRTDDQRSVAALSVELGNAFRSLDPDLVAEAVAWYDRAIQQLGASGEPGAIAEAYLERGRALRASRPLEALDDLSRSHDAAERAHDPIAAAAALLEGVPVRIALGHLDEAERDNQLAEQLLEHVDAPDALERARLNAGFFRERRGQWEGAEEAYRDAIERAAAAQDEGALAEAHFSLARLYLKIRDFGKARQEYEEAARLRLPQVRPGLAEEFRSLGAELEREGAGASEGPPS